MSDNAPFLAAQDSLMSYACLMDAHYVPLEWHRYLCSRLEAAIKKGSGRIMVFAPPRHGKSRMVSTELPAWYMGKHPRSNVICASYGATLAERNGQSVRDRLGSKVHQTIFSASKLSADSSAKTNFKTTAGGHYLGTTVRGEGTGMGASLFVIDDPFKSRQEAESARIREEIKNWYRSVVYTRLEQNSIVVVMHTRWHVDDLAGWLLEEHEDEGWEVIDLPAVAIEDDVLGRKTGDVLAPERYDADALQRIKRTVGSREWMALYQQQPVKDGGAFFNEDDVRKYERRTLKDNQMSVMTRVLIIDPAFTKNEYSDYTAMLVVGLHTDGNKYVLDGVRERLSQNERWRCLLNLVKSYQPHAVLYKVRRAEGDRDYIYEKMEHENYRFDVTWVTESDNKEVRIQRLLPDFEAHKLFFPVRWDKRPLDKEAQIYNLTDDLLNEVRDFPAARHDDLLDCLSELKGVACPDLPRDIKEEPALTRHERRRNMSKRRKRTERLF